MNTIFIPVYPKPSGANVTELCVDFNAFDPHNGVKFSVVMKNPEGLTLDKTYTSLAGEDWQDWPPEQTAGDDYNYVKNVVLRNLGYIQAVYPYFVVQPESIKVLSGANAEFSAIVSGDAPLSLQWYKNAQLLPNETSATLFINSVSESDVGSYTLKIQNNLGSKESDAASLSMYSAPVIISNPSDVLIPSGANAYFNVGVNGDSPITIEWFKNDQLIPDSNNSQYIITGVTEENIGTYKAKATNIAGSIESSGATLSIAVPALIENKF